MFSNILIYFVVIPLVMMLGLALCRNIKQIRAVAVTGSVALTALSVWLLVDYLALRAAGATEPMLWLTRGSGSHRSTSTLRWVSTAFRSPCLS